MKRKKHTIFLLISLMIFVATVIVCILNYCESKAKFDNILSESSDTQLRIGLELSLFGSMFFAGGILCTELSFIRSVYKMLKYKPIKFVRICYIISSAFAFLAIAFYCLTTLKIFSLVSSNGHDYIGDIYLFTLWPSFILSFALGSIPIKHSSNSTTQNKNSTTPSN